MIRTESEYRRAVERLERETAFAAEQRAHLESLGLSAEQIDLALQPAESFREQLKEEIATYEAMCRGELGTLTRLTHIGRWLIGVRIAQGLSQKQLAEMLGVSEAQVSRDERNEYHGITVERAQYILEKMGVRFRMEEVPEGAAVPSKESQAFVPPGVNVPAQVAVFLRADPNLAPDKAEHLTQEFQQAYERALAESKK
ncbi:helix-turn-helix domain-containing protein [Calidithermus chliarophilus]|uniref:helix-turn-helix domain-containing protein n=1 Tax=Calidithermus chliarophilus TaxID=52023 RepID=UPI000417DA1A|nr:helix-turn-helix transcriptional regulator [Calidithermus chliarophilus]